MNLTEFLRTRPVFTTLYAGVVAFMTYLCFYPFRRAYTAATYENISYWDIDFKILMITAQVIGFAVSKGIGIKFVSELGPAQRSKSLWIIAFISWVCYGLFALTPAPYSLVFIFLASLPLGMVYGILLGYLEGRTITELLVATLTASFIVGSGFAKSIGKWVMVHWEVSETTMPFVASGYMLLPFAGFVWALSFIPPPTDEDQRIRSVRQPMDAQARRSFVKDFGLSLIIFVISYVLLTTFREFRDNFAPEIWAALGRGSQIALYTQTEIPIAIFVLFLMIALRWVKNNYRAFWLIELWMLGGGVLIGLSTWLFERQLISAEWWLVLLGLGVYVAYAMCNSLYFERMIAAFQRKGTIGFLITYADYYAYFGSVLVLLYKNYFQPKIAYLDFFIRLSYTISGLYIALVCVSMYLLSVKYKKEVHEAA
ncbi:MAG: DUF5690 family protein [Spirosomataceae bacterium]